MIALPRIRPKRAPKDRVADLEEEGSALLPKLTERRDRERARLDLEWEGIQSQIRRLEEVRSTIAEGVNPDVESLGRKPNHSGPAASDEQATDYRFREEERLRDWEKQKRVKIDELRRAEEADEARLKDLRKQFENLSKRRCPLGLTYEECERYPNPDHFKFLHDYREDRGRLTTQIQQSTRLLAEHHAEADRQAGQLSIELENRRRQIEFGVSNLERQKEAARQEREDRREVDQALEELGQAIRERMRVYNEDAMHLEKLDAEIESLRSRVLTTGSSTLQR